MRIDISDRRESSTDGDAADTDGADALAEVVGRAARFAMEYLRLHPDCELSIAFVDDDAMADLHEEWLQLPGPTDVLSFPMDEVEAPGDDTEPEPGVLGDIVLAPAFITQQAAEHGSAVTDEITMLTVHGLLHLVGHDHVEPEEHARMFGLQGRIVEALRAHEVA